MYLCKLTNFAYFAIPLLTTCAFLLYNNYNTKRINETFLRFRVFLIVRRPPTVTGTLTAEVHAAKHPILGARTCNTVFRVGQQNPRPHAATVLGRWQQGTDLRTRKPMVRPISFSPSDRASLELICLPLRVTLHFMHGVTANHKK